MEIVIKILVYLCVLVGLVYASKYLIKTINTKRDRYCNKCMTTFQSELDYCPNCKSENIIIFNPDGTTIQRAGYVSTQSDQTVMIVFCMTSIAIIVGFLILSI